jgi:hypothetical protein
LGFDITALAKEIADEEGMPLPATEPGRVTITLQKLGSFARGYEALIRRAKFNQDWVQIAEEMGFPSPAAAYRMAQRARQKLAVESKDDLRFRQRMRLDELYDSLQPAIKRRDKNTPRAVEVAVKVMEREARLEGLDLEGATQQEGNKAIIFNIQPHPNDQKAREVFGTGEGEEGKTANLLLPPSTVDVEQFEEVHLPDRGNGLGEDVERSVLGS